MMMHDTPFTWVIDSSCRMVDVIATFSMLLDIPAFTNWLDSARPYSDTGTSALSRGVPNTLSARIRSIVRVCRILRLMRLVHMFQQYQVSQQTDFKPWEALEWLRPIALCVVWLVVPGLDSGCPMATQHSPCLCSKYALPSWLLLVARWAICLSDHSLEDRHRAGCMQDILL